MSCTGCGSSFGLLKKEVGCEICGFSFCSKCCAKRSVIVKSSNVTKRICNKCYEKSNSPEPMETSYSPPMAHKKRMERLNNRSLSMGANSSNSEWMNQTDKEIAERLQRLKRERNKDTKPSQSEIEERLAKLKGMDPAKFTAPPIEVYRPMEKKSALDQTSDLMKQIVEEVQIDAKRGRPEDEIAARLARLRDEPVPLKEVEETVLPSTYIPTESSNVEEMDVNQESQSIAEQCKTMEQKILEEISQLGQDEDYKKALRNLKKEKSKDSDDDIDEDETDRLVKQLLAVKVNSSEIDDPESLNGAHLRSPDDSEKKSLSDDDEFPWCVICTEDAKIRCFGCDSDLYCMNCFRECHDSLDIKDHKTCPFLSPKKL